MEAMGCVTSWYGFWSTPAEGIASVQKDRRAFLIEDLAPVVKPQSISTLIGGKVQFVQGTNGHQVITLVRGL